MSNAAPRRAAHFLLIPELANSPPNEAFVGALLELGFDVDLYAPRMPDTSSYGPAVKGCVARYGYRWIGANLLRPSWAKYSLFSGTTEDPLSLAGVLSCVWRRPLITLADEIRSGSYAGNRSTRWKRLCRFGMRRAALTVVNEEERLALQRDYAGMSANASMIVYPGCYRAPPPPADREAVRAARGIPHDSLLVCYSGTFNLGNGGLWFADAITRSDTATWFWAQALTHDPLVDGLLERLRGATRLYREPHRLGWREAWSMTAASDIGIVVYLQDAAQFKHMGIASNRLCMFLAMGVPVIASRQPSFAFVEEYDCGVLVSNESEFRDAIAAIAADLPAKKRNALRCAHEYIAAPRRYTTLRQSIASILK